jgi:hypothetical protein
MEPVKIPLHLLADIEKQPQSKRIRPTPEPKPKTKHSIPICPEYLKYAILFMGLSNSMNGKWNW